MIPRLRPLYLHTYSANGNATEDPKLRGIDRGTTGTGMLDPRPHSDSPALMLDRADYPDGDDFFSETNYIGAFGGENWLIGWTALDDLGYIAIPTSIEQVSAAEIPSEISLNQNYPNPFNPVTTVEFDLDRAQNCHPYSARRYGTASSSSC